MSEEARSPQQIQGPDVTAEVRLHPPPPVVMRLSRRVLMGLAAIGVIVVSSALIWGLYQHRNPVAGTELYNTENKTAPDGLSALPRDYTGAAKTSLPSGVPRGEPLPGDLGRPMVNALPASGTAGVDPEQQRIAQENEAARTSRLFAPTSTREAPCLVGAHCSQARGLDDSASRAPLPG